MNVFWQWRGKNKGDRNGAYTHSEWILCVHEQMIKCETIWTHIQTTHDILIVREVFWCGRCFVFLYIYNKLTMRVCLV